MPWPCRQGRAGVTARQPAGIREGRQRRGCGGAGRDGPRGLPRDVTGGGIPPEGALRPWVASGLLGGGRGRLGTRTAPPCPGVGSSPPPCFVLLEAGVALWGQRGCKAAPRGLLHASPGAGVGGVGGWAGTRVSHQGHALSPPLPSLPQEHPKQRRFGVSPALPWHPPEVRCGRAGPEPLSSEPPALGPRHRLVSAKKARAGTLGTLVGKDLRWIAKAITHSWRCPPETTPVPGEIHPTPDMSNLSHLQRCGDSQQNTGQA